MKSTLSTKARQALKQQAHHLQPVVMIGNKGITETLIKEVDASLNAHELIKIRALTDDREERETLFNELCEALDAQEVQRIGKLLVLWRPNETPAKK